MEKVRRPQQEEQKRRKDADGDSGRSLKKQRHTSSSSDALNKSPKQRSAGTVAWDSGTDLVKSDTEAKNYRLACFLANEYLSKGTLLGNPWPPRGESKGGPDGPEEVKKGFYYYTVSDFLRSGHVHLPGIVNPSQLSHWFGGFK